MGKEISIDPVFASRKNFVEDKLAAVIRECYRDVVSLDYGDKGYPLRRSITIKFADGNYRTIGMCATKSKAEIADSVLRYLSDGRQKR